MSDENTSRIDDYLSGELAETDRLAFEADMAADENLRKEVRLHELERAAAILIAQQRYQKKYAGEVSEEKEPSSEEEKPPIRIRRWGLYAASIALLLLLGLFWWVPQNYSNAALAGEVQEAVDLNKRKRSGMPENKLSPEGRKAYFEEKNYGKATLLFEQDLEDSIAYGPTKYMLAYCKYHLGEYKSAIQLFDEIIPHVALEKKQTARNKAQWTQLMAYLKRGDLNDAFYERMEALKVNGNPEHKEKARQLEQRLNSFWRRFVAEDSPQRR